jgi:NADH dehydrogenase
MRPPRSITAVGSVPRLRITPAHAIPRRLPTSPAPFASTIAPFAHRQFTTNIRSQLRRYATFDFPPRAYQQRHPYISLLARLGFSSVLGLSVLVGAILLHDAFTYSERHVDRVPANPLSLQPRLGGKKNLPILEVNLDDEEDDTKRAMKDKPRLVIVGGGWGVSEGKVELGR